MEIAMMTRANLLALAARVEREEPSRELQIAVLAAFGWETLGDDSEVFARHNSVNHWQWAIAPDPLRSLDAAASLCPAGWRVWTMDEHIDGGFRVVLAKDQKMARGVAPDEKRARTAAALRARAMEARDE
jgi:hypothetical protein